MDKEGRRKKKGRDEIREGRMKREKGKGRKRWREREKRKKGREGNGERFSTFVFQAPHICYVGLDSTDS